MEKKLYELEFIELITPRFNPYLWDIFGGILSPLIALVAFWFNHIDNIEFLIFITILTILGTIYIFGNIVFENCSTYTYEFESIKMPDFYKYHELTGRNWIYGLHIVNRKYYYEIGSGNEKSSLFPFTPLSVDKSHLKFELTMYFALNDEKAQMTRSCLYWIYWFGITKRNFTIKQYVSKEQAEHISIYVV